MPDIEQQQKSLRRSCSELTHKRKQLNTVRIENDSLGAEYDRLAHDAQETARKVSLLSENKGKSQQRLSEQRILKADLEVARKKVTDDIQTTKLTQRFGPLARSPVHKSKVDLILALRREVDALRRAREELALKKKLLMIDSVRDSQRLAIRHRPGIEA
jgi:hypothetical protein